MRSSQWRLTLGAITVLMWVVAIIWFLINPGFEPLIAFLAGLASLIRALTVPKSDKALENLRFAVTSSGVGLSSGGIELTRGEFSLSGELVLSLWTSICVHNSGSPTSVRLRVASIGPGFLSRCLTEGTSPEDINIEVSYRKQPKGLSIGLGNPFIAETGDRNIDVKAKVPFDVSGIEETYGALASFEEMEIVLEARLEGTGTRLTLEPLSLDLAPVHKRIEKEVVAKIPKYPVNSTRPVETQQLVLTLKRYWIGRSK